MTEPYLAMKRTLNGVTQELRLYNTLPAQWFKPDGTPDRLATSQEIEEAQRAFWKL